ncbi:MAG: ABC transporter ATP-binding protein [Bacteroidota bacterium]
MIRLKNIKKSYRDLSVLNDINLEINNGKVTVIVGPSGAGKSTLLHIIGTLDRADSGEVWFSDIDINSLSEKQVADFRNKHIGFVFQFHHLLPEFTAIENVSMPALIAGKSKKEAEIKALELLEILGVAGRKDHKPSELSGGEQQRVAVARALINNPLVVLADEPSGNLDSDNARELHQLFFKLRDQLQQTFIIVTHNQELADMSDFKILMRDGKTI